MSKGWMDDMSFGTEWFHEHAWEIDAVEEFVEEFNEKVNLRRDRLSVKTNDEILDAAIRIGPKLNDVTEHFPAYDVALKLKNNKWTPTEKQRKAIINVTAFYQTKKKLAKKYGKLF